MRLPHFLCIGAQKSGTTMLYEILKKHPQIFLPDVKEIHFFNNNENYDKGLEWYEQHFSDSANNQILGDITPAYIFFEYVPGRIKESLGIEIKLLAILRNPIDRAYSHYWMSFKRDYENLSFEKAILMEHSRLRKGYFEKNHFSYTSRGFYAEQIKRYLLFFPKDNVKVIIFEEFLKNPEVYIKEILGFLGCDIMLEFKMDDKIHSGDVDIQQYIRAIRTNRHYTLIGNFLNIFKFVLTKDKKINYPPLKEEIRSFLKKLYKNDINELEILLKKDLSVWLNENGNF